MRLVTQTLQEVQHRIAGVRLKRRPVGKKDALMAGIAVRPLAIAATATGDAKILQDLSRHGELAGAAVDQHQVRPLPLRSIGVFGYGAAEAAGQYLPHHRVIVAGGRSSALRILNLR